MFRLHLISFLLIFGFILQIVNALPTDSSTYETKYDNIDLDEILNSERLLKNYINCLRFEGPCTPDGRLLRDTLPDAIETGCSKCTEKQKYGSDKVTHFLIDNKPEEWETLEKIYDKEGNYRKEYLARKNSEKE